jgi:hypothetical protein
MDRCIEWLVAGGKQLSRVLDGSVVKVSGALIAPLRVFAVDAQKYVSVKNSVVRGSRFARCTCYTEATAMQIFCKELSSVAQLRF